MKSYFKKTGKKEMSLREWLMGKKTVDGYFHRACLLEEHHGPISKKNTGSDTPS